MAGPSEQSIQRRIIRALEERGAYVVKVQTANHSGVPDIVVAFKGLFYAFEVKRPGETATKLQEYHIQKILRAGGRACVVTSVQEAIDQLEP